MPGLLNNVFGNAPQPTTVPLDTGSQNLENQMADQSNQPSNYYSGILNSNLGQVANLGQNDQQMNQSAQSMGMAPGQMEAIRNVYSQQAGQGINRLTQQNELKGQMMKADYMNQMSRAMLGIQQNAVNQYGVLSQAYQQQEYARAGVINSLFQTANFGIGMAGAGSKSGAGGFAGGASGSEGYIGDQYNYANTLPDNSTPSTGGAYNVNPGATA
jgi:hypothetical protein